MDNNKQSAWSDVGHMLGRAMLLLAPAAALFTIAVSWAQLADRQDRLRLDLIALQGKLFDYARVEALRKTNNNNRAIEIKERLSRLETSYKERRINMDRRMHVLERKRNLPAQMGPGLRRDDGLRDGR